MMTNINILMQGVAIELTGALIERCFVLGLECDGDRAFEFEYSLLVWRLARSEAAKPIPSLRQRGRDLS